MRLKSIFGPRSRVGRVVAASGLVLLVAGCALPMFSKPEKVQVWFHAEANPNLPGQRSRQVTMPVSNLSVVVDSRPALTEKDIVEAELVETAGGYAILLKFDNHGRIALDQLTTQSRGRCLVVFLDQNPLVAWKVDRRLSLGQFLLEADLDDAAARELVDKINAQAQKIHAP